MYCISYFCIICPFIIRIGIFYLEATWRCLWFNRIQWHLSYLSYPVYENIFLSHMTQFSCLKCNFFCSYALPLSCFNNVIIYKRHLKYNYCDIKKKLTYPGTCAIKCTTSMYRSITLDRLACNRKIWKGINTSPRYSVSIYVLC